MFCDEVLVRDSLIGALAFPQLDACLSVVHLPVSVPIFGFGLSLACHDVHLSVCPWPATRLLVDALYLCASKVIGEELPANVLYFAGRCIIHQIFRAIVEVLTKFAFMAKLFCLVKVFNAQSHKEKLLVALKHVVENDLSSGGGYILGGQPPAERRCEKFMVACLLWRRRFRDDSVSVFAGRGEQDALDRGNALLELLQGPWSSPTLRHYCSGRNCPCGGSREAAQKSLFDLLSWLVIFSLPATPSFSRWPLAKTQLPQSLGIPGILSSKRIVTSRPPFILFGRLE